MVEQVQRGIVGVPSPRRATATLPLITLPRRDAEILPLRRRIRGLERVVRDADILVRARAVRAPGFLAIGHVERGDAAANAELTTRDSREDEVVDDQRGVRHRLALLEVGALDCATLLARLRVERERRRPRGARSRDGSSSDRTRVRDSRRHNTRSGSRPSTAPACTARSAARPAL